jgi:hypothetical protein
MDDGQADREIQALVGQSAGHIAYHSFGRETLLSAVLVEAAQTLWESLRSPWMLVEAWYNGTTLWRSPDGTETAIVTPGSEIQTQSSE